VFRAPYWNLADGHMCNGNLTRTKSKRVPIPVPLTKVFADADAGRARHSVRAGRYGKPEYFTPPRPRLVTEIFPELMNARRQEDNTPSCSVAEALGTSGLVCETERGHVRAATPVAVREGGLNIHGYFINLESGRVTPLPIK
jgi:hypothetical protein